MNPLGLVAFLVGHVDAARVAHHSDNSQGEAREWIVELEDNAPETELQRACTKLRCGHVTKPGVGGAGWFVYSGTSHELDQVVDLPIKHVVPNEEYTIDPVEATATALIEQEPDQWRPAPWGLARVGAVDIPWKGVGVNIYIWDTGIRVTHEEFGGRARAAIDLGATGMIGKLKVCSPKSKTCAADEKGHGTLAASIAAGETFGVATGALVWGVKALNDEGRGSNSKTRQALEWLTGYAKKPAVVSAAVWAKGTNNWVEPLIKELMNSGVLFITIAGNGREDACGYKPAFAPSAVTVGAIDERGHKYDTSNYGSCVDIWAPGENIRGAGKVDDTRVGGGSGTSQAAPFVAGVAAIYLEWDRDSKYGGMLATRADILWKTIRNYAESGNITGLNESSDNNLLVHLPPKPS